MHFRGLQTTCQVVGRWLWFSHTQKKMAGQVSVTHAPNLAAISKHATFSAPKASPTRCRHTLIFGTSHLLLLATVRISEPNGQRDRASGRGQEEAVGGEDIPEEDAAGAHPPQARHLHRLSGGGRTAHVGVRRGEGRHCVQAGVVRPRPVQDIRRNFRSVLYSPPPPPPLPFPRVVSFHL